jgi:exosome complex exonuclease RRP6
VKDTNYFMVIGRNKTLNSASQISALKAVLKWRDFVARLDDESPAYMLPNHIMFQICKDMPTTINELRDCCRAQTPPAVIKYQDQFLHLIEKQINKKPKESKSAAHLNIKFTQAAVSKQSNPETVK